VGRLVDLPWTSSLPWRTLQLRVRHGRVQGMDVSNAWIVDGAAHGLGSPWPMAMTVLHAHACGLAFPAAVAVPTVDVPCSQVCVCLMSVCFSTRGVALTTSL
jgi:hypothetical protein